MLIPRVGFFASVTGSEEYAESVGHFGTNRKNRKRILLSLLQPAELLQLKKLTSVLSAACMDVLTESSNLVFYI